VLQIVRKILKKRGKRLVSLAIFGSSVYNPMKAEDIDLLIIVDLVKDVFEKSNLEMELSKTLKKVMPKTSFDVVIFDIESFKENLEPGTIASGLIYGYKILYDELGLEKLLVPLIEKIAHTETEYVVQKNGRRINLSAFSRVKLRLLHGKSDHGNERR